MVCGIAEYFYGLCCILRSPPGLIKIQRTGKNIQRYYTKTTTKLFIIQLFKANELQTTKNVWRICACGATSSTKLAKLVLYCTIDGFQSRDETAMFTIESNSQKTFATIVLYTNMAAVTSDENRLYRATFALRISYVVFTITYTVG